MGLPARGSRRQPERRSGHVERKQTHSRTQSPSSNDKSLHHNACSEQPFECGAIVIAIVIASGVRRAPVAIRTAPACRDGAVKDFWPEETEHRLVSVSAEKISTLDLGSRRAAAVARGVSTATPLFAVRASNAEIWDSYSRLYIEFAGSFGVLAH